MIEPGEGDVVDQICFVDCHACQWPGPGLNIVGGTNIEALLGGYYSCNGAPASPPTTLPSAGIAITGPASGVRIVGAACNNSVFAAVESGGYSFVDESQQYGIYVGGASDSGATNVRIHSCDLTGNTESGVYVTGANLAPQRTSSLSTVILAGYPLQPTWSLPLPTFRSPNAPATTIKASS